MAATEAAAIQAAYRVKGSSGKQQQHLLLFSVRVRAVGASRSWCASRAAVLRRTRHSALARAAARGRMACASPLKAPRRLHLQQHLQRRLHWKLVCHAWSCCAACGGAAASRLSSMHRPPPIAGCFAAAVSSRAAGCSSPAGWRRTTTALLLLTVRVARRTERRSSCCCCGGGVGPFGARRRWNPRRGACSRSCCCRAASFGFRACPTSSWRCPRPARFFAPRRRGPNSRARAGSRASVNLLEPRRSGRPRAQATAK